MLKKALHLFRSMAFGMVLLVLILACSLAGSLIAQGKEAAWYAQTYPGWHGLLMALGLNDVFNSWYFIALLVLLCLNLTLCSLVRIRRVVKLVGESVPSAARLKTTMPLTPEGRERLLTYLEERRFRKTETESGTVYIKNRAGWYGSFVTHLAILLTVLFGAAAIYLPVVTDQTCMPGQALTMEDGTQIHVEDFHIENGAGELDYASTIHIALPDGRESGSQRISVNHPCSFGGYKVYQQTYGTAGVVSVRNLKTGGEDRFLLNDMCFLSLDGVNGVWFEALYPGYIRDPSGNITLITQTSGTYENPIYQIQTTSDGVFTPVMAFPGDALTIGDVEFTFETPEEYPGLRIKRTPTLVNGLLCAVFLLMIAGLWLCFFQVPGVVVVREEGCAVGGPKPQGLELELAELLGNTNGKGDGSC